MICGISVNITKQNAIDAAIVFSEKLLSRGVKFYWENNINVGYPVLEQRELANLSDIVVVFGGDGSVLRIAAACADTETPVFTINLGRMSFLAEYKSEELDNIVDAVVNGNYVLEERCLLEVTAKDTTYLALNEAVVARGSCTRIINFTAHIDGQFIDRYFADGVLVSTPTGSTAYNLSAGGPIITPDVDALVLTPICPHSLTSRPVVFSAKSTVVIKYLSSDRPANLAIDGRDIAMLNTDDEVKITSSDKKLLFARPIDRQYVNKLIDKLNNWGVK